MPGTLKDMRELEEELDTLRAQIDGAGDWGITKADILDFLDKLLDVVKSNVGVAGSLRLSGGTTTETISGGWNRMDIFTSSRDTQGLRDGLADATDPGGWFEVLNSGAGNWMIGFAVRFTAVTAGTWEIRVATALDAGSASGVQYEDAVTAGAGEEVVLAIPQILVKNLKRDNDGNATNNRFFLQIRESNNAQYTPHVAYLTAERAS